MGSAICSPLVEVWDVTSKLTVASDSLELSSFSKAQPRCRHPSSEGLPISSFSDGCEEEEEVPTVTASPLDAASTTTVAKVNMTAQDTRE
ncbi:Hypothetical predicted protein [Podarcis lilfordi]|uniref:Uncharacterized protein n=1 Tax=Podarcis lilfordi TaxID=74358 RepID=A0AA35LDY9_9SAUR|nr:Hypothetical predicted protein [Podarcis lilfordi]